MKFLVMLLLVLSTSLPGCVHLDSVSTSTIPMDRSRPVKAEGSRFLFMLINFNNNYVNELSRDLARQCPRGRVEGILTKQESVTYFPFFAHLARVKASGYCVERKTTQ